MFLYDRLQPSWLLVRYKGNRRSAVRDRIERVWKRIAPEVPFDAEFSDDIVAELYDAEEARASDLRRLRGAGGGDRLPRPVRPRRLHRRAAHQGDRHPQGVRRAGARHRPAARLAILEAGHRRQPDRLADRLVGDARLAERLRRPNRRSAPARSSSPALLALAIALGTIAGHAFRVARANPIHALRYE